MLAYCHLFHPARSGAASRAWGWLMPQRCSRAAHPCCGFHGLSAAVRCSLLCCVRMHGRCKDASTKATELCFRRSSARWVLHAIAGYLGPCSCASVLCCWSALVGRLSVLECACWGFLLGYNRQRRTGKKVITLTQTARRDTKHHSPIINQEQP